MNEQLRAVEAALARADRDDERIDHSLRKIDRTLRLLLAVTFLLGLVLGSITTVGVVRALDARAVALDCANHGRCAPGEPAAPFGAPVRPLASALP